MSGKSRSRWSRSLRRLSQAAQNAAELIQAGRLTEPYHAAYEQVYRDRRYALRRYQGTRATAKAQAQPILLVPPLMLTAEIYDMAEDISATAFLLQQGLDVWVVDFGAPEKLKGGMDRTLDDHVTAVSDAIDRIIEETGADVHLAGYSQGGMFAYQAAAFREARGLASVITFGSPVDIHRNVPNMADDIAERLAGVLRTALGMPIDHAPGLPGFISSTGFKLLSARKELGQMVDFVAKLHDRQELEKREAKRLFLRGQGFVAWPGPAFRDFVDEFVVANRMTTGGLVIDGRTVTLADIRCPILCFLGERDEIAFPAAVKAIERAAPDAEVTIARIAAGHFGLVVGSEAMRRTWPMVRDWVRWRGGEGERPSSLDEQPAPSKGSEESAEAEAVSQAMSLLSSVAQSAAIGLSESVNGLGESVDHLRYQLPKLSFLRQMEPGTRVSFGHSLSEQARRNPSRTFFVWQGRALSYAQADQRVDNVVKGLIACGVCRSMHVAVLMSSRPSYVAALVALNRLGAVPVLIDPDLDKEHLEEAIRLGRIGAMICDPDHVERAQESVGKEVLVLGGGAEERTLPFGAVDMEAIDPNAVTLPSWYEKNPGRARDLAMVIVSTGANGSLRAMRVSNRRWAFSAYGAAAAATLTEKDTVYSCLPLHHMAGTMVSVGSALVAGARVALARTFDPESFWSDVRRDGATVVFYAGEMCRLLLNAPMTRAESNHPVRLFAGSGLRADVWGAFVDRFGPLGILEFYASTEANAVLANASGEKVGSVGRPMPGSAPMELLAFDLEDNQLLRDEQGKVRRCEPGELGMLATKLRAREAERLGGARVLRDVFELGDFWYLSNSLLTMDREGDYWFVERRAHLAKGAAGIVCSSPVEDALCRIPAVALAAVYSMEAEGGQSRLVAQISLRDEAELELSEVEACLWELSEAERPEWVFVVDDIELSDGFRVVKDTLPRDRVPEHQLCIGLKDGELLEISFD